MTTTRVRVTPEMAADWLANHNNNNRPIIRQNVKAIANDIKAGLWRDDHPHGIVFDVNGNLADGQHRLHGIVEAKMPVLLNVTRGLPTNIRDFIDTGKARRISDRVTIHSNGRTNQKVIAMAKYFSRSLNSGTRDMISIRDVATEHSEALVWAASWIEKKVSCVTVAPIAAALAKLYTVDRDVAVACASSLLMVDGDVQPMRVLRDWALRHPSQGGGILANDMHSRAFSAVKAALEGRNIAHVRPTNDTSIQSLRSGVLAAV